MLRPAASDWLADSIGAPNARSLVASNRQTATTMLSSVIEPLRISPAVEQPRTLARG
jgi:hypothetical protein